jgi:DNA-binding NarL/FixJ family response regulator
MQTTETPPVEIILVEDNREYREVITFALRSFHGVCLQNQFANAELALRHLEESLVRKPDVILLDLRLPGISGIEAIPLLRKTTPQSRIILLTQSDHEADVLRAISMGASGYLLKSAMVDDIVDAILSVNANGASFDPAVAKYLLDNLKARLPEGVPPTRLSDRESEILRFLSEGLVKKEIADRLSIGYSTVDTHVRHIYEKLQVCNAPAAVNRAYRLGIFTARRPK